MRKCLNYAALPALCITLIAHGAIATALPAAAKSSSLQRLTQALDSGDEAIFDRFVQDSFAPSVLAENPVEAQVARLARVFTETGGLAIERIAGQSADQTQAEVRDRIAGVRYCLTVNFTKVGDRELITGFTTQGLYPAGPVLQTPSASEVTGTIDALASKYAMRGLFSGVILIARDGRIVLHKAYGEASIAFGKPMTLDTRLNVASIGKSLTGVAIAQLVDAGKLSYDDPVGKLLPDYPDRDVRDKVTLRQLLSHTSGLGPVDYWQKPEWEAARAHLRSVSDYMKLVVGTPIGAERGKFLYSNSGYVILGAIIERASGQSYYDYVADHIFRPAGMSKTFYHELDAEDPDVAVPLTNIVTKSDGTEVYHLGRPRSAVFGLAAKGGPQGGAYMTARDLLNFEKALFSGKLVSAVRLKEMTAASSPSGAGPKGLTGDVREGLGIEVITQNGHRFYGHTGGDLGIASLVYSYPDLGFTTIALTNRDARATRIVTNVSRSLLTRHTLNGAVPPLQKCESQQK